MSTTVEVSSSDIIDVNTSVTEVVVVDVKPVDVIVIETPAKQGPPGNNTVNSVAGKQGDVLLDKSDVGLSNVDNTADINKPISNSTQDALDNKVDKVSGKGLSESDYTTAEKSKLDGIAPEATKNRADSENADNLHTHTMAQVTGLGTALESKVDKQAGKQLSDTNFTQAEKDKLSSLESSKFVGLFVSEAALPLSGSEGDYANVDGGVGSDVYRVIWDSSDNKWVRVQGVSTELTDAQIKQQYESNPDTNAFTNDEKSKLAGIASEATKNRDDSENADKEHTHTISQVTGLDTALADKVGKETGKGLVANEEISKLGDLPTALEIENSFSDKVDKEEDKGLVANPPANDKPQAMLNGEWVDLPASSGGTSSAFSSYVTREWKLNTTTGLTQSTHTVCWSETLGMLAIAGTNYISTSEDGISWTSRRNVTIGSKIIWAESLSMFILTTNFPRIFYTSTNGITWVEVSLPSAITVGSFTSVACSNELGVGVATNNQATTNNIVITTNGTDWVLADTTIANRGAHVIWVSELGKFVAGGIGGFQVSSDGNTWIAVDSVVDNQNIHSIAWSNKHKYLLAIASRTNREGYLSSLLKSEDGVIWERVLDMPTATYGGSNRTIDWIDELGMFISVGGAFTMKSFDGVNWLKMKSTIATQPRGVVWCSASGKLISPLFDFFGTNSGIFATL